MCVRVRVCFSLSSLAFLLPCSLFFLFSLSTEVAELEANLPSKYTLRSQADLIKSDESDSFSPSSLHFAFVFMITVFFCSVKYLKELNTFEFLSFLCAFLFFFS